MTTAAPEPVRKMLLARAEFDAAINHVLGLVADPLAAPDGSAAMKHAQKSFVDHHLTKARQALARFEIAATEAQ
jgi:hypothetical protein